jgi:hypothetical protein
MEIIVYLLLTVASVMAGMIVGDYLDAPVKKALRNWWGKG